LDQPERKSIPELVAETLELVARFVREQARETVEKNIIGPLRLAGSWVGAGCVASALAAIGVIFLAVGLFQALAAALGSAWAAWLIVGGAYLLAAVAIILVRLKFKPESGADGGS
jgi:hypothetical protein